MAERALDPQHLGDHLDRLYRAAWALCGSREDAEDLVQDTYTRVLARPRMLRNDDDLGYLMSVMRNTFISRHRTQARRPRTEPFPEGMDPADERPELRPDAALEARDVFGVIATLPPDFRDALVAVDVAGLSYREAGKLLGAKEATITSRLFRARKQVTAAMRMTNDSEGGQESPREGVI
ncbi:MAG: polymerase, sigma-24 subunit, subfamily [Solirubrobacteraceae bacterium]|nr:polymerase, sigma-24 subunit, subfamily [Solirubrobacteraceae bacterium]